MKPRPSLSSKSFSVHHIHHLPAIPPFDDTVLSETDNGEKQTTKNIGAFKVTGAVAKFKTKDLVHTVTLKSANNSYSGISRI